MSVAGVTTATVSPAIDSPSTATAQASPTTVFQNAPTSVQTMFTTASATQPSGPQSGQSESHTTTPSGGGDISQPISGAEKFESDELVVYSLASGPDPGRIVTAIRNSLAGNGNAVRAYLEQSPAGNEFSPGARRKSLGSFSDKVSCQVSFRYASEFKKTDAVWQRSAKANAPKLVEYTVRVWPSRLNVANFEDARDADGRRLAFQMTSAVAIR
jgi:hypothetical protein